MTASPEQHDPDWSRYPETILRFSAEPPLSIDLRRVITEADIVGLRRIGLAQPFAVITAFDPRGKNLSGEKNDQLARKLDATLRERHLEFTRVDACSPDGGHCECSVAVKVPKDAAVELGAEFEQVALFWFDGSQFWILGALLPTDPIMLPRSS